MLSGGSALVTLTAVSAPPNWLIWPEVLPWLGSIFLIFVGLSIFGCGTERPNRSSLTVETRSHFRLTLRVAGLVSGINPERRGKVAVPDCLVLKG